MQRLTGLDAAFLSLETPSRPHAGHRVSRSLDPTTSTPGFSYEHVRELLEARAAPDPAVPAPARRGAVRPARADLDRGPRLRPRLPLAPRRAAGARWSSTSSPRSSPTSPAGHSTGRRPLWEAWVVEGLDHGYYAFVAKIHHSLIDGASGVEILASLFDLEPDPEPQGHRHRAGVGAGARPERRSSCCRCRAVVRASAGAIREGGQQPRAERRPRGPARA